MHETVNGMPRQSGATTKVRLAPARMLGLLVGQRLRLGWNRITRGPGRGRRGLGAAFMVVFIAGFFGFAGLNSGLLVDRIGRSDPVAAQAALPTMLAAISFLTLFTSLGSAFHHLFLAPDLEILLAAPVPRRSFLGLKLFETWRDSVHILLFQAAALIGIGQALHVAPAYYPLAEVMGLALTLGATAIGLVLTLLLARLRFGEPLLGATRLISILLFVPIGLLGVPTLGIGRGRFSPVLGQGSVQALATSLRELGSPPDWLPSTWAANLALNEPTALTSAALILALGVIIIGITQATFERFFQFGWERARFAAPRSAARATARSKTGVRPPADPVMGVLQKDWRTLMRDPRWRTGALISLVALGLPAVAIVTGDPFARAAPGVRLWLGLVPVPYLAYIFGSQQGAATLAYEGRNIALLRAAPISMGRIVFAKVLGGLVMVLGVTLILTLVLSIGRSAQPLELVAAVLAATWLSVGVTVAAVAGAALTVDFESDNPQRRVGCMGTIVTSALSLVFFGSSTALFGWAIIRALGRVPRPYLVYAPVVDYGLAALAVISVVVIVLAMQMGLRRLAGWEAS
jgi:Putative ATP-binding cassette